MRDAVAEARVRRDRRNAVIAGATIGFVSTFATIQVTRKAMFWHSFLLESLLGALADEALMCTRSYVRPSSAVTGTSKTSCVNGSRNSGCSFRTLTRKR